MSDARLRSLERRWKESGAPEDWNALLREQHRTGVGHVAEVGALLGQLADYARTLGAEERPWALADLAWGLASLGNHDWARELAREARALASRGIRRELRVQIRLAAVESQTGDAGRGEVPLASALETLASPLARDLQLGTTALARIRADLVQWWRAAADARLEAPEVLERACVLTQSLGPADAVRSLSQARDAILCLGLGGRMAPVVSELLQPSGQARLRETLVRHGHGAEDGMGILLQECAEAVAIFRGGELSPADAEAYSNALLADPSLLDEFSIWPLAHALRALSDDPSILANAWRARLVEVDQPYRASLVAVACVRALAQGPTPRSAWPILLTALDEAWGLGAQPNETDLLALLGETQPKFRALNRLIAMVPRVAPPEQAIPTLAAARARSLAPDSGLSALGAQEVRHAIALASSRCAWGPGGVELLLTLVGDVEGAWRDPPSGEPWWLQAEILDGALEAAQTHGALARPVIDAVRDVLEVQQAAPRAEVPMFLAQTWLRTWRALNALRDSAGQAQSLERLDALIPRLNTWDLGEILETAATTAAGANSLDLARWALRHAAQQARTDDLAARQFVHRLCEGAVAQIRVALSG